MVTFVQADSFGFKGLPERVGIGCGPAAFRIFTTIIFAPSETGPFTKEIPLWGRPELPTPPNGLALPCCSGLVAIRLGGGPVDVRLAVPAIFGTGPLGTFMLGDRHGGIALPVMAAMIGRSPAERDRGVGMDDFGLSYYDAV